MSTNAAQAMSAAPGPPRSAARAVSRSALASASRTSASAPETSSSGGWRAAKRRAARASRAGSGTADAMAAPRATRHEYAMAMSRRPRARHVRCASAARPDAASPATRATAGNGQARSAPAAVVADKR